MRVVVDGVEVLDDVKDDVVNDVLPPLVTSECFNVQFAPEKCVRKEHIQGINYCGGGQSCDFGLNFFKMSTVQ